MQKVYYNVPNKLHGKTKLKATLFVRKLYTCYAALKKKL